MSVIKVGIVKFYNTIKGFGFITNPDGVDVFFHHSALPGNDGHKTVFSGDKAEYNEIESNGRLRTHKIYRISRE